MRVKKWSLPLMVLMFSALAGVGCKGAGSAGAGGGSAAAGKASALEGAAVVIDVRTPAEHEGGHLEGDVLIPVNEVEARLSEIEAAVGGDKAKKVVTYCRSGNRAGQAKALLEAHGFTNVVNAGGYDDLK